MRPAPKITQFVCMSDVLKAFLINLNRSPKRLAQMAERLQRLDLLWQRVEAVEGRALNIHEHPHVSVPGYMRKHGKRLNPAEVGCYLSHIKALEAFLAHPTAQFGLILEDDVSFCDDFLPTLNALMASTSAWDMVRLSGFHSGTPVRSLYLTPERQLCVMLSRQTNSAAYLVNRKAASLMVKHLLPMELPYDHAFDKPWEMQLKARMVHPLPTKLDWDEPSTITPAMRLPWYRRWSTYRYRLRTELRRVIYALGQLSGA
jgi:glycosyl transferase, family 25